MCRLRRLFDGARRADEDRSHRQARRAAGRSRKANRIAIDYARRQATATAEEAENSRRERSAKRPKAGAFRPAALSRWFGITVKPMTAGSVLVLQSDTKLPVELQMERQQRAARIHPASFDLIEPAAGRDPLSHVAGAGPRLRRQRRSDLSRRRRGAGRPRKLRSSLPAKLRTCPTTRRSRPHAKGKPSSAAGAGLPL